MSVLSICITSNDFNKFQTDQGLLIIIKYDAVLHNFAVLPSSLVNSNELLSNTI